MGKIPNILRENIARNIREHRMGKFPGRGGGKKCAEAFGVSPQQWSPWERGMRTPDELRLQQIADFFGTTVEELRRDNTTRKAENYMSSASLDSQRYPSGMYSDYGSSAQQGLRESDSSRYHHIPSLRRDDGIMSATNITDLTTASARLLGLISSTTKGVVDGRYEISRTISALRVLGDILEERLREVENQPGRPSQPQPY